MTRNKTIDNKKYARFKCLELWIEEDSPISKVYSYSTLIGYLDWQSKTFKTWGYSRYSKTTSRQITILCNREKLTRLDIKEPK